VHRKQCNSSLERSVTKYMCSECLSVGVCACVTPTACVCETSLGGHFRALDQTCGIFSCEDLFQVLQKSGCTAVFSVLGMHVSVSFRQVLGSEHCSCSVCVCVCSTAHATTRMLDDMCVVRPHLGGHFCALDQTCEDVFSCKDFFQVLGKSGRFSCEGFFGSSENVCVFV